MELSIPPEQAIAILRNRLAEIDGYNFNPQAWKDRTENDLKEIFPLRSFKWLQVSQIRFDTFIVAEKAKTMAQAKDTAKQLISSYIEFIEQYTKIAQQTHVAKENKFEDKYYELLKEWNEVIPEYNKLVRKQNEEIDRIEELTNNLTAKDQEIERIKSETIQLDNVSFTKLIKVFLNLPLWQIVSTFTVIAGIIGGMFVLGTVYQKNEDNNTMFEIRTELQQAKTKLESKETQIEEKEKEIQRLKTSPKNLDPSSLKSKGK